MNVVNAGVTYQRLPRVAAAAATTAITMTAYHPVAVDVYKRQDHHRNPHTGVTNWAKDVKPIAAAVAPAAPRRTP